jgi:hypothetical protein
MQTFNIVRGTGLLTLFWAGRDMQQDKKKVMGQMQQVVFLVGRS